MTGKCTICNKSFRGRSDKKFCSIQCKNFYHVRLRSTTNQTTKRIDAILHRNRSILQEIMGKNSRQKRVQRLALDRKGFNFKYITGYYINSKAKMVHYIYDYALMEFSDQGILILRR